MILTVTPNPCVDKTIFVDDLTVGGSMRSARYSCIPGGKGTNVSRAVHALGRATKAMLLVGGHSGAHVVEMVREQDGVEPVPVWVASPTRTITTVLEEPVHRQTVFFEPGSRVTDGEARRFVEAFETEVQQAKVVVFSGTVPDPSIHWLYRDLVSIARNAGVVTILDSHGPEFASGLDSVPYMVKPNLVETEEIIGKPLPSESDKIEALDFFHRRGVRLVVMSLGKDGALVSLDDPTSPARTVLSLRPPEIREVNAVGSGDCLVAGFAIGLMEGMDIETMARIGVAAGTANAQSWDIGHFEPRTVDDIASQVSVRRIG